MKHLSGGERRRIAITRLVLERPQVGSAVCASLYQRLFRELW